MMKRRNFLSAVVAALFARLNVKGKPEVCGLCGKPGHRMEEGHLQSRYPVEFDTGEPRLTIWCENAPVDWGGYTRTIYRCENLPRWGFRKDDAGH